MNTVKISFDRPAIFRSAWAQARAAAAAASEKVGQHIGAALRAAWASARMVPQPVQQQQAQAGTVSSGACEVCGRPLTDPVSIEAGIGPICRTAGHRRRQLELFDNPSDYRIELAGDVICITDLVLGGRTVTNDAAGVIADLLRLGYDLTRMPVIYRDTQGNWDELRVLNGNFAGFRGIDADRKAALRAIAKGGAVPATAMVPQPVQQQQADAKAPTRKLSLEERRLALHNAGIRAINRGNNFMADYVEEHPRWRHDGKSTAVRTETLAEAVTAGERLLAEYEASMPARGYEFNGKVYESAQDCYIAMMDMEDGKGTSAFALVTGLVAFDRLTGARLSIDEMSDRFCAENGPSPEIDTAPDLSTAGGLAEVLVGRTANLRMTVGEVVYTISGVRRWTSPDGTLVRDYITLETFGKEADDRMGPVKLHIERAGGGRGSHGMTKAGMARWSYGAHCDSGSNQARADELVRELLANIVEV